MITAGDKRISGAYDTDYSVSFYCEHMTITLNVIVTGDYGDLDDEDEDNAIKLADKIITDYYGFSPMGFCHETNVDYCGEIL